jgi:ribosome-binding factor A
VKGIDIFVPKRNNNPRSRSTTVATKIKACLADALARGNCPVVSPHEGAPPIPGSITIMHVDVSPDLNNATIYVTSLAGAVSGPKILQFLEIHKGRLRHIVAQKVKLRAVPKLTFKLDETLEYTQHIEKLLGNDHRET